MTKFQYISGPRLIEAVQEDTEQELNEDNTLDQLSQNVDRFVPKTRRRQYATDTVQIAQMQYIPAPASFSLKITGLARNFWSGKKYDTVIVFNDVDYEKENTNRNITFTAVDGEEYHVLPINLRRHTVRVACNCLDFYWRFALWNFANGSLEGEKPKPYVKKTNRPPVNPEHKPGICKHLIKTVQVLRQARLVTY